MVGQDTTAKKEGKANNPAAESTRNTEIEPIQEWPVEENMKLEDFIQRVETSPFKIKVHDNYKEPEVQSETRLESSVANFINSYNSLLAGAPKH